MYWASWERIASPTPSHGLPSPSVKYCRPDRPTLDRRRSWSGKSHQRSCRLGAGLVPSVVIRIAHPSGSVSRSMTASLDRPLILVEHTVEVQRVVGGGGLSRDGALVEQ